MSLYEEALVEAKKLKELAEEDAKQAIVKDITPYIRKMISNELAGKTSIFYEETELSTPALPDEAPATEPVGTDAPIADPTMPASTASMDAPIKVAGGDNLNIPMPDDQGMLTLTFDEMFVDSGEEDAAGDEAAASAVTPPEPPGGLPSPEPVDVNPTPDAASAEAPVPTAAPPVEGEPAEVPSGEEEPKMETFSFFKESLETTALLVEKAYLAKSIPSLVKEALQEKLYGLLESLGNLTQKQVISKRMAGILENRLEIMHLKLKEAVMSNTYNRIEGTDMASKSLKEFAAKMIAESDTVEGGPVTSPADVHKTEKVMKVDNAEEHAADKAGTHAQKVTEPSVTLKTLEEELLALVSESEGDSLADDEGKQDLAGAASSIPNKKVGQVDVTKSTSTSSTNSAAHVQGVSEGKKKVAVSKDDLKKKTKKLKMESLRKKIASLREELSECGMDSDNDDSEKQGHSLGEMAELGEPEEVVTLPAEISFDIADLLPQLAGMKPTDEIDIVDDEEASTDLDDDGEIEIEDGEDDADDADDADDQLSLSERIKRSHASASSKALAENKVLKAQLAEQQLFNAKVVHLQPFLNNTNLTKEQKQKIVEYLDRGKSIDEVKTIYTKVKTVLENVQKAKAKAGSSSRVASSGAASLKESVSGKSEAANLYENATLVASERNRLMELAGIKRK